MQCHKFPYICITNTLWQMTSHFIFYDIWIFGVNKHKMPCKWDLFDYLLGFPDSSVGKESTCNAGNLVSIPGLGRFPGEGKGNPLQYSGLQNSPWSRKVLDRTERLSLFGQIPHAARQPGPSLCLNYYWARALEPMLCNGRGHHNERSAYCKER